MEAIEFSKLLGFYYEGPWNSLPRGEMSIGLYEILSADSKGTAEFNSEGFFMSMTGGMPWERFKRTNPLVIVREIGG